MVLTLYKVDFSPPARAALMTIGALKLKDVEFVDVNLFQDEQRTAEYTKMNPQQTVPTLKDGDFCIWDSHVIGTYLIDKYGKDDSLYPKDLKKRAIVNQRLHFDSGVLFPAGRNITREIFEGATTIRPELLEKVEISYDLAEKFLKTSKWMAGDTLTIADICCVATLSSTNALHKIDENKYPNLHAWLQRCSKLDFYQKYNAPGLQMISELVKSKLA